MYVCIEINKCADVENAHQKKFGVLICDTNPEGIILK